MNSFAPSNISPSNSSSPLAASLPRRFSGRRQRRTSSIPEAAVSFPRLLLPLSAILLLMESANSGSPASVAAVAAGHCPQWVNDEIQQCVQPMAEFAKTLNRQQTVNSSSASASEFGQSLHWPAKMGGQVFRDLCRLISDFELCVVDYRQKCRKHITISLIEASYGFLCNEGYTTFMASADCLMELDQKPVVKRCHDRTLKDIEEANRDQSGVNAYKLDKMCNALNFFSDCVRLPIRQSCGRAAWQVIFRVLKDTTRTLMPMCQFGEESGEEEDEMEEEGKETGRGSEQQQRRKEEDEHSARRIIEKANLERRKQKNAVETTTTTSSAEKPKIAITEKEQQFVGGWEQWEEELVEEDEERGDNGRNKQQNAKLPEESHHQIHYERSPQLFQSQNGGGQSRNWNLEGLFFQFLTFFVVFFALSYCNINSLL